MRRYLDPTNIPKTPSQEVFGRLGYSSLRKASSFHSRSRFICEYSAFSKGRYQGSSIQIVVYMGAFLISTSTLRAEKWVRNEKLDFLHLLARDWKGQQGGKTKWWICTPLFNLVIVIYFDQLLSQPLQLTGFRFGIERDLSPPKKNKHTRWDQLSMESKPL